MGCKVLLTRTVRQLRHASAWNRHDQREPGLRNDAVIRRFLRLCFGRLFSQGGERLADMGLEPFLGGEPFSATADRDGIDVHHPPVPPFTGRYSQEWFVNQSSLIAAKPFLTEMNLLNGGHNSLHSR